MINYYMLRDAEEQIRDLVYIIPKKSNGFNNRNILSDKKIKQHLNINSFFLILYLQFLVFHGTYTLLVMSVI